MNTRREFLKKTCAVCAVFASAGVSSLLESCAPLTVVNAKAGNDVLNVPVSRFGDKNQVLVRSLALEFDILLIRDNSNYTALLMKCTHEDQPLTFSGTVLNCASHGSRFDMNGNVVNPPAQRALQKFPTEVSDESIIIHYKK
jgi:nitrite reductase/ring-hydroxylating ferredoxin subunit